MQALGKSILSWKLSVVVEFRNYLRQRFLSSQKLMRLSLCGDSMIFEKNSVFSVNQTLNYFTEFVYLEGVHLG